MIKDYPVKKKRPPEYFKYIQKISYSGKQRKKIEEILTTIPIRDNYFASLILLGKYINENTYPPYLKRKSFKILKERVNRIQLKTTHFKDIIRKLPDNSITKFNLSNIFDWVDDSDFRNYLNEITRVGMNKSRFFYYVTRKDRSIPDNIPGLNSEKNLAIQLLKKDRTMLYNDFEIGSISLV
jgi:S-adenosylmethionine-diacylglycerol 3-amino-3-carboxypropyl transferase